MTKNSFSPKKRLASLFFVVVILALGLIGRLAYLQLYKGEELKKEALQQWTRGVTIKSKRGIIYDRNGKKLANTVVASTVWANPKEIKEKNMDRVVSELSRILGVDEDEMRSKLDTDKNSIKIEQWVEREVAEEIKSLSLPGIQVVEDNKRQYPYGKFASYILGFTDIDNNGLYGLERTYDRYLKGTHGKRVKVTDEPGSQLPFDGEKVYDASHGLSLVLTLDETIQKFAENAARNAYETMEPKNISVIIMEPKTGDILAMVNMPDYDPNNPREPLNDSMKEEWEGLSNEELQQRWYKNWRNFSINDVYEPGSTFKIITAAAAIEENAAQPNTGYYCNGFIRDIKGVTLKCSKWYDPHRNQSLTQGIANSCNIVSVETARRLGKENLLRYIKAFGFGESTGIDLNGEQHGLVPYRSADAIKDVELATMSYGHGIAVTPMQLVNAVSAIANGGNLMKPRLVKEMLDVDGNVVRTIEPEIRRKVISETTSKKVLEMMESVIKDGTGKNAYIPGYHIAGKTGTAEKVVDGVYADGKYIGSFVAVAPVEDPQIAMLVVVDDPKGVYYGGSTAAPLAKEILEDLLPYLEISPQLSDKEKAKQSELVEVPDVRGKKLEEAGRIIKDSGLKYATEYIDLNENSKVLEQNPQPKTYLPMGSIIDLSFEIGPKIESTSMPDLKGKTKEEAIEILDGLGLKYKFKGQGKVVEQSQKPGVEVDKEINIEVELKEE